MKTIRIISGKLRRVGRDGGKRGAAASAFPESCPGVNPIFLATRRKLIKAAESESGPRARRARALETGIRISVRHYHSFSDSRFKWSGSYYNFCRNSLSIYIYNTPAFYPIIFPAGCIHAVSALLGARSYVVTSWVRPRSDFAQRSRISALGAVAAPRLASHR